MVGDLEVKKTRKIKFLGFAAYIIICISFLNVLNYKASAENISASSNVKTNINITNNGVPISYTPVSAINYQNAESKIKMGKFSSQEISSKSWKQAEVQYSDEGGIIALTPSMRLGKGVENSDVTASRIIIALYNNGGAGRTVLAMLNTGGTSEVLYQQGNLGRKYSDINGNLVGELKTGWTLFVSNSLGVIGYNEVTKNNKNIYIDYSNQFSVIKSSIIDAKKYENSVGSSIVSYGQDIVYKITVDKRYLSYGAKISIMPSPTEFIDSISIPSQSSLLVPSPIVLNRDLPDIYKNLSNYTQSSLEKTVLNEYAGKSISSYSVQIPSSSEDVSFFIHAHIVPVVRIYRYIMGDNSVLGKINNGFLDFASPNTVDTLKITTVAANNIFTNSSPSIRTAAVNFANIDLKSEKFVSGAEYVLGKKIGKTYYVYSLGKWINLGDKYKIGEIPKQFVLGGGKQYYINTNLRPPSDSIQTPETSDKLIMNDSYWGYNQEIGETISKSLFQLYGLASNTNYFLQEVSPPKGYSLDTGKYFFKAYLDIHQTTNGTNFVYSSFTNANNQLPGKLMADTGFSSGNLEYNALPVDSKDKNNNFLENFKVFTLIRIIVPMGILICLLISVMFKIIRELVNFEKGERIEKEN